MRRIFGVSLALSMILTFGPFVSQRSWTAPAPAPREKKVVTFDETALLALAKSLPPKRPPAARAPAEWRAVEKDLGTRLPEEYRRFFGLYGRVTLNGYLRFLDPFGGDKNLGLAPTLERVRDGEKYSADLGLASQAVWPAEGGLLPIASTPNGDVLAYRTRGAPDGWTVAVLSRESEVEEHDRGLIEFLARLVGGQLRSDMLLETKDLRGKIVVD